MKIVNWVYIDDELRCFDDLTKEKRKEVSQKLNEQALSAIGYIKGEKDKTA